jgi:hypothetical protein
MTKFTTADGKYSIVSHGNGWAYEVVCQATGGSFWVQDDDACQLQKDTDNFENTNAIGQMMEQIK